MYDEHDRRTDRMRYALPAIFAAYLVFASIPALASPMNRLEVRQCAEMSAELPVLERSAKAAQADVYSLAAALDAAGEALSEADFQASIPSKKKAERTAKAEAVAAAEARYEEAKLALDGANAELRRTTGAHGEAASRFNRTCASRGITAASAKACDAPDLRDTPFCQAVRGG